MPSADGVDTNGGSIPGPLQRAVVTDTLGKDHERCFDDIYQYYAEPESWRVRPGARTALLR